MAQILPRYPVYIPSKGRADHCLTAKRLVKDGCPFNLVVEASQQALYAEKFPTATVLVLPFENQRSVIPARNWIKNHATEAGFKRHWQLDDNICSFMRRYGKKRIVCSAGVALRVCEDFTDRYKNIAISGLNYKMTTMTMKGGNTEALYQGDGRLKMACALERLWPGIVTTKCRFQRAQHIVKDSWKGFDTPLIRREDIDFAALEGQENEYGIELKQVSPEIKSPVIQDILTGWQQKQKESPGA